MQVINDYVNFQTFEKKVTITSQLRDMCEPEKVRWWLMLATNKIVFCRVQIYKL